jgi:hypothetical protein
MTTGKHVTVLALALVLALPIALHAELITDCDTIAQLVPKIVQARDQGVAEDDAKKMWMETDDGPPGLIIPPVGVVGVMLGTALFLDGAADGIYKDHAIGTPEELGRRAYNGCLKDNAEKKIRQQLRDIQEGRQPSP